MSQHLAVLAAVTGISLAMSLAPKISLGFAGFMAGCAFLVATVVLDVRTRNKERFRSDLDAIAGQDVTPRG